MRILERNLRTYILLAGAEHHFEAERGPGGGGGGGGLRRCDGFSGICQHASNKTNYNLLFDVRFCLGMQRDSQGDVRYSRRKVTAGICKGFGEGVFNVFSFHLLFLLFCIVDSAGVSVAFSD